MQNEQNHQHREDEVDEGVAVHDLSPFPSCVIMFG